MAEASRRQIIDRGYSPVKLICWFNCILSWYNKVYGDMQHWNQDHVFRVYCRQFNAYRGHFLRAEAARVWGQPLHSSTEVYNDWSCTTISPVCLHGIYRGNYTFMSVSIYDEWNVLICWTIDRNLIHCEISILTFPQFCYCSQVLAVMLLCFWMN